MTAAPWQVLWTLLGCPLTCHMHPVDETHCESSLKVVPPLHYLHCQMLPANEPPTGDAAAVKGRTKTQRCLQLSALLFDMALSEKLVST